MFDHDKPVYASFIMGFHRHRRRFASHRALVALLESHGWFNSVRSGIGGASRPRMFLLAVVNA